MKPTDDGCVTLEVAPPTGVTEAAIAEELAADPGASDKVLIGRIVRRLQGRVSPWLVDQLLRDARAGVERLPRRAMPQVEVGMEVVAWKRLGVAVAVDQDWVTVRWTEDRRTAEERAQTGTRT